MIYIQQYSNVTNKCDEHIAKINVHVLYHTYSDWRQRIMARSVARMAETPRWSVGHVSGRHVLSLFSSCHFPQAV